jgi:pilus assembly protein CpaF
VTGSFCLFTALGGAGKEIGLSTAQAIVEDEVRELVRRRGIDPVAEGGAVRQLVDEVVDDYRDRAVTAALPPLGDPSHITRRVVDAVAGFGPLQPFLDDPEIEEIGINEAVRCRRSAWPLAADHAHAHRRCVRRPGRANAAQLRSAIDLSTRFVDAMLPAGSRLHVGIPQITRTHLAVNIRKFVLSIATVDELVASNSISSQAANFLEAMSPPG